MAEELASGRLVRVMEPFTPAPRPVHLLWRQDLRPLPKLTEFIAHILLRLGNDSNLLIVFYVQIMPDDLVMQLHRF